MKFLLLLFLLLGISAWADNGHGHDHGSGDLVSTNDLTGGDQLVNVGGDSSKAYGLGFSYALGDVDLNEGRNCYVSVASGNIIFGRQKVKLNPWCASLFYDANRKFEFAAKMRCSIDPIRDLYDTDKECTEGQTMRPGEITSSPELDEIVAKFQEAEDEREAVVEEIQQQLEQLTQQRSAPVSAPRSLLSNKQRAALEEIINEGSN